MIEANGCFGHFISYCTASILNSREGLKQGGPLANIAYGIRILPLINNLKREIPDITHSWYADDARGLVTFTRLETYFDLLMCHSPGLGYPPRYDQERTDCTPR